MAAEEESDLKHIDEKGQLEIKNTETVDKM